MRNLTFVGQVHNNMGKFHREMVLPGREFLASAPSDWPTRLAPGTLNVKIDPNGRKGLAEIGSGMGMKKFDEGLFKPAFLIAQQEIEGNTLKPKDGQLLRGTAQVWRAELAATATGAIASCWMLRRIGSGIASQIELVSADHLRSRLQLENGTHVTLKVFEG